MEKGDVEEGFRQSDVVVENTFQVPAVHQAYIEPHSCVVQVKPDGGAEVWASTKSPFAMREQVGSALQIPHGYRDSSLLCRGISAAREMPTKSLFAMCCRRKVAAR